MWKPIRSAGRQAGQRGAEGGRGGAQVGRKVECSCRDASCTRQPNTQQHPTPSTQQQGSCGAGASAAPALSIERMTSSRRGKVRKISEEGKGECRKMPHLQRQAQWSSSALEARNLQSHSHVLPRIGCLPACLCFASTPRQFTALRATHSLHKTAGLLPAWPPPCPAAQLSWPSPCPALLPASLDAMEALAQQGGQHQQVVVVDPHKVLL